MILRLGRPSPPGTSLLVCRCRGGHVFDDVGLGVVVVNVLVVVFPRLGARVVDEAALVGTARVITFRVHLLLLVPGRDLRRGHVRPVPLRIVIMLVSEMTL